MFNTHTKVTTMKLSLSKTTFEKATLAKIPQIRPVFPNPITELSLKESTSFILLTFYLVIKKWRIKLTDFLPSLAILEI